MITAKVYQAYSICGRHSCKYFSLVILFELPNILRENHYTDEELEGWMGLCNVPNVT